MSDLKNQLKDAINIVQRAQRNYNLSKSIPQEDLDLLIYAAKNSPSKQNETHFSLHIFTDEYIIKQIYDCTKKFTLGIDETLEEGKGEQWLYENRSVKNSQIYANVLFVYIEEEGKARGATHLAGQHGEEFGNKVFSEQKNFSMGISVGELILTAGLLGYKTGICSAMDEEPIQEILKTNKTPKLLVGIGFENEGVDRRLHAEVLNRDIDESRRTGPLDEKWRFPSFDKDIKVIINGNNT
jgi:nitroreductase